MVSLLLGWASTAHAADVVRGANLLGMGDVGVAAPADNAGITLNPGLLGLRERYDFHAHGQLGPDLGLQWAATAMDGRTSKRVAAGLAYSGDRFEPALTNADLPAWSVAGEEIRNRKRLHDITGGLAVPLLSRRLSLGVSGALTLFNHDQGGQGRRFDMHAGVGLEPVKGVTVGASLRNFLVTAEQNRPTELLAGLRLERASAVALEMNVGHTWVSDDLGALEISGPAATLREIPTPWSFAGGVDARAGSARVRAGASWRGPTRKAYATLGIGTREADGGGVEYALAIPLRDLTLAGTIHQISIRFGAPPPIEES